MEVIDRLYVGDDVLYEKLAGKPGWSFLRPIKFGPGGHKELLGYTTNGAPKGPNYLQVRRGNLLALNILDTDDPDMIPDEAIDLGLKFLKERYDAGDKVLSACNAGHTRGPTMMLMFLRAIGEMPDSFVASERKFRTLYPPYDPGVGMRAHARARWKSLPEFFK